jgi:hypothetical protein
MTPVCKIKWLERKSIALFKKTFKFISIKEFIWFKLFGEYEVDYSIASATGMFDIGKLTWNESALTYCGITPQQLSAPVEVNHCRSEGLSNDLKASKEFHSLSEPAMAVWPTWEVLLLRQALQHLQSEQAALFGLPTPNRL